MVSSRLFLFALLLPSLAFALSCDTYPTAELNEWKLAECSSGLADTSCFAFVNDTATGKPIDFFPENGFTQFQNRTALQSFYTNGEGVVAIYWRVKPELYYEGNDYTLTVKCGNESATDTFAVSGFGSNTQMAGSISAWLASNSSVCLIALICIAFGMFIFGTVMKFVG